MLRSCAQWQSQDRPDCKSMQHATMSTQANFDLQPVSTRIHVASLGWQDHCMEHLGSKCGVGGKLGLPIEEHCTRCCLHVVFVGRPQPRSWPGQLLYIASGLLAHYRSFATRTLWHSFSVKQCRGALKQTLTGLREKLLDEKGQKEPHPNSLHEEKRNWISWQDADLMLGTLSELEVPGPQRKAFVGREVRALPGLQGGLPELGLHPAERSRTTAAKSFDSCLSFCA